MREMVKGGRAGSGAVKRGRSEKGSGVFYQDPLGRPRGRSGDSNPRRMAIGPCQCCAWVTVIHRMTSDNSPSVRGQRKSTCQWVGMRQYAAIRTHVCAWAACRMYSKVA